MKIYLPTYAPRIFSIWFEKSIGDMGYTVENMWVDQKGKSIFFGEELNLSITLGTLKTEFNFGAFREEYIGRDIEFVKLLKVKQDELVRLSKGQGKG